MTDLTRFNLRSRTRALIVVVAAVALVGTWRLLPPATPPIYDGSCPVTPYLSLHGSPPAQGASKVVQVVSGDIPTAEVVTPEENGPQAQMLVTQGTFVLPPGTPSVTLTITPVDPPAPLPPDGKIDGNVYRFSATTDTGKALTPTQPVSLLLRATSVGKPSRVIEHYNGSRWTPLSTSTVGCADTYYVTTTQLGDYAAVMPGSTAAPPSPSSPPARPSHALTWAAGIVAAVFVLLAVTIAVWRARRTRR